MGPMADNRAIIIINAQCVVQMTNQVGVEGEGNSRRGGGARAEGGLAQQITCGEQPASTKSGLRAEHASLYIFCDDLQAASELFGFARNELVGRNVNQVGGPITSCPTHDTWPTGPSYQAACVMVPANQASQPAPPNILDTPAPLQIIPPPFCDHHNNYVRNYLTTGKAHLLNRTNTFVALHKERNVLPISLTVSKVSGIGEDTMWVQIECCVRKCGDEE